MAQIDHILVDRDTCDTRKLSFPPEVSWQPGDVLESATSERWTILHVDRNDPKLIVLVGDRLK